MSVVAGRIIKPSELFLDEPFLPNYRHVKCKLPTFYAQTSYHNEKLFP